MKKVLLTTVTKPFGLDNEHVLSELFHAQVTKVQGIFSFRSTYYGWGIEFIANNLKTPTTVLHYPTEKEFLKEINKGYDFIGINFVIPTWHKAKKMIEMIRENSPKSKIILGGYGTVLSEVDLYADYVCRGEGLEFMQNLLGEKKEDFYNHPVIINEMKCISLPIGNTGVIFAGLGCPNGCDFCCTSHFFKKKHIPFLKTGKEIFMVMKKFDSVLPNRTYSIIDEDFLKDEKRIKELYEFTSKEIDNPRFFSCFSSAKSISQYDPEWLFELGVDTIWIGVESKMYGHQKLQDCNIQNLFSSLHQVGINTLGSMILGLDNHTKENIEDDINYLISLKPTLSQFLIYSPCPTTPLYNRLDGEGRLQKDYPFEKRDGFHLLFKHPNFSASELEKIQLEAFNKEFYELGPSVIRYVEKAFLGYQYFSKSTKPIHLSRRKVYRDYCIRALPLFEVVIKYAPSQNVKIWANDLKKEILKITNFKEKVKSSIFSNITPLFAIYTKFIQENTTFHLQPKTLINRYNFELKKEEGLVPNLSPVEVRNIL